jgi:short-subunit dehydrogenase
MDNTKKSKFSKKTILITGASTGIGKSTAEYFQNKGWNVAASMRNPQKNDLKESKSLKKYKIDVTNKKQINDAVKKVIKDFGRVDVLLNNAGYGAFGPVECATDEQIRRQFDVNVFGLIDMTKVVLPYMRKNKSGVIINISSVAGQVTMPLGSLYHGTKFCVEGISEAMNYELNPLGIKVKLVEPGGVKTDFAGRSLVMFENEIRDYDPIINKMMKLMHKNDVWPSLPLDVAKVIYKASSTNSKKMRFPVGSDAKLMLTVKRLFGPKAVNWLIKKMFKI